MTGQHPVRIKRYSSSSSSQGELECVHRAFITQQQRSVGRAEERLVRRTLAGPGNVSGGTDPRGKRVMSDNVTRALSYPSPERRFRTRPFHPSAAPTTRYFRLSAPNFDAGALPARRHRSLLFDEFRARSKVYRAIML